MQMLEETMRYTVEMVNIGLFQHFVELVFR